MLNNIVTRGNETVTRK